MPRWFWKSSGKKQTKKEGPDNEGPAIEMTEIDPEEQARKAALKKQEEEKAKKRELARKSAGEELEFARSLYDDAEVKVAGKKAFSKISTLLVRYNRLHDIKSQQADVEKDEKREEEYRHKRVIQEIENERKKISASKLKEESKKKKLDKLKEKEEKEEAQYKATLESIEEKYHFLGPDALSAINKDTDGIKASLMLGDRTSAGMGYTMTTGTQGDIFKANLYINEQAGSEGSLMGQMSLLDNAVNTAGIDPDSMEKGGGAQGGAHFNLSEIMRNMTEDELKQINSAHGEKFRIDMKQLKENRENGKLNEMLGDKKKKKKLLQAAKERGIMPESKLRAQGKAGRVNRPGNAERYKAMLSVNSGFNTGGGFFGDWGSFGARNSRMIAEDHDTRRNMLRRNGADLINKLREREKKDFKRLEAIEEGADPAEFYGSSGKKVRINKNDSFDDAMKDIRANEKAALDELVKAGHKPKKEADKEAKLDDIDRLLEKRAEAEDDDNAKHMMAAYKMLGATPQELLDFRLALIAYLVPSGRKSVVRIVNESHEVGIVGAEGGADIAEDTDKKVLFEKLRKKADYAERVKQPEEEKNAYKWAVDKKKYRRTKDGKIEEVREDAKPEPKPEEPKPEEPKPEEIKPEDKKEEEDQNAPEDKPERAVNIFVIEDRRFAGGVDEEAEAEPLFGENNEIKADDVRQGGIENSSLMAALAGLADADPDYIRNTLVKEKEGSELVTVRLYTDDGLPSDVLVSRKRLNKGTQRSALWVHLVEKAASAFIGKKGRKTGYKMGRAFDPASISADVEQMSGADDILISRLLFGNKRNTVFSTKEFTAEDNTVQQIDPAERENYLLHETRLRDFIKGTTEKKQVVTAATCADGDSEVYDKKTDSVKLTAGLKPHHEYTILGMGKGEGEEASVMLRDPYGANTTVVGYKEDKSAEEILSANGVFEIKLGDFMKCFTNVVASEPKRVKPKAKVEKPEKKEEPPVQEPIVQEPVQEPPVQVPPVVEQPQVEHPQVIEGGDEHKNDPEDLFKGMGEDEIQDELLRRLHFESEVGDEKYNLEQEQADDEPLFGENNAIEPYEVRQGDTFDCYILATLSGLASKDPEYIRNTLLKENKEKKTVTVRLYNQDGSVCDITVSKKRAKGGAKDSPLWVHMVEKAAASLIGRYGNGAEYRKADTADLLDSKYEIADIGKGSESLAMRLLFGKRQHEMYTTRASRETRDQQGRVEENGRKVINAIREALPTQKIIIASTCARSNSDVYDPQNDSVKLVEGLKAKHEYTIVGIGEVVDGEETVSLRDPYGNTSVTAYNQGAAEAGFDENGRFNLKISDFLKCFSDVAIGGPRKEEERPNAGRNTGPAQNPPLQEGQRQEEEQHQEQHQEEQHQEEPHQEEQQQEEQHQEEQQQEELLDMKTAFGAMSVPGGAEIIGKWQELGDKLWKLAYVEMGRDYLEDILVSVDKLLTHLSEPVPSNTDDANKNVLAFRTEVIKKGYKDIVAKGIKMANELPRRNFEGCDEAAKTALDMSNLATLEGRYFNIGSRNYIRAAANDGGIKEGDPWIKTILSGKTTYEEGQAKRAEIARLKKEKEEKDLFDSYVILEKESLIDSFVILEKPVEPMNQAPPVEPVDQEAHVEPLFLEGPLGPAAEEAAEEPLDEEGYIDQWKSWSERLNDLTDGKIRNGNLVFFLNAAINLSIELAKDAPKRRKKTIFNLSSRENMIKKDYDIVYSFGRKIVSELEKVDFEGAKETLKLIARMSVAALQEKTFFETGVDKLASVAPGKQVNWASAIVKGRQEYISKEEARAAKANKDLKELLEPVERDDGKKPLFDDEEIVKGTGLLDDIVKIDKNEQGYIATWQRMKKDLLKAAAFKPDENDKELMEIVQRFGRLIGAMDGLTQMLDVTIPRGKEFGQLRENIDIIYRYISEMGAELTFVLMDEKINNETAAKVLKEISTRAVLERRFFNRGALAIGRELLNNPAKESPKWAKALVDGSDEYAKNPEARALNGEEEKPVEEKHEEEKPVEEKREEEKPVEEKHEEEKPVEEKPVEEKREEEKPVEKKHEEEKPVEEKPAEGKPAGDKKPLFDDAVIIESTGILDDIVKIDKTERDYSDSWKRVKQNLVKVAAFKPDEKDKELKETAERYTRLIRAIDGLTEMLEKPIPIGEEFVEERKGVDFIYRYISEMGAELAFELMDEKYNSEVTAKMLNELSNRAIMERRFFNRGAYLTGTELLKDRTAQRPVWAKALISGSEEYAKNQEAMPLNDEEKKDAVVEPKVNAQDEEQKGHEDKIEEKQEEKKAKETDDRKIEQELKEINEELQQEDKDKQEGDEEKEDAEKVDADVERIVNAGKRMQKEMADLHRQHELNKKQHDEKGKKFQKVLNGQAKKDAKQAAGKGRKSLDLSLDVDAEKLVEAEKQKAKKGRKSIDLSLDVDPDKLIEAEKQKAQKGRKSLDLSLDVDVEKLIEAEKQREEKAKEMQALDKNAQIVGEQSFTPITTGEKVRNRALSVVKYALGAVLLPVNLGAAGISKLFLIHKKKKRPKNVQENRNKENIPEIAGRGKTSLADKEPPKDKKGNTAVYDDVRNVPLVWEFMTAGDTDEAPEMSINVDQPVAGSTKASSGIDVGHTFISLSYTRFNMSTNKDERYKLEYGFYPKDGFNTVGLGMNMGMKAVIPGMLKNDKAHEYSISKRYNVTVDKINDVLKASEHYSNSGYNVITRNCTTFAVEMGRIAGLPIADQIKESEFSMGKAALAGATLLGGVAPAARYSAEIDFEERLAADDISYENYGQKLGTVEEIGRYKKTRELLAHTPSGYLPAVTGETIRNVKETSGEFGSYKEMKDFGENIQEISEESDNIRTTLRTAFINAYKKEGGKEKDEKESDKTKTRSFVMLSLMSGINWKDIKGFRSVDEKNYPQLKDARKKLNDWRKLFCGFISKNPHYIVDCRDEVMRYISIMENAIKFLDDTYEKNTSNASQGDLKSVRTVYTGNKISFMYRDGKGVEQDIVLEPTIVEAYLQMYGSMDKAAPVMGRYCKYVSEYEDARSDQERARVRKKYDRTISIHDTAKDFAASHRYRLNKERFDKEDMDYAFKQLPEMEKTGQNTEVAGPMVRLNLMPSALVQSMAFEPGFRGFTAGISEISKLKKDEDKAALIEEKLLGCAQEENNKAEIKKILSYFYENAEEGKTSSKEVTNNFVNKLLRSFVSSILFDALEGSPHIQSIINIINSRDSEFKKYIRSLVDEVLLGMLNEIDAFFDEDDDE